MGLYLGLILYLFNKHQVNEAACFLFNLEWGAWVSSVDSSGASARLWCRLVDETQPPCPRGAGAVVGEQPRGCRSRGTAGRLAPGRSRALRRSRGDSARTWMRGRG